MMLFSKIKGSIDFVSTIKHMAYNVQKQFELNPMGEFSCVKP